MLTHTDKREELIGRIHEYLALGGLFNPELMDHDRVRDLLVDCRNQLVAERSGGAFCQPAPTSTCSQPPPPNAARHS